MHSTIVSEPHHVYILAVRVGSRTHAVDVGNVRDGKSTEHDWRMQNTHTYIGLCLCMLVGVGINTLAFQWNVTRTHMHDNASKRVSSFISDSCGWAC